MIRLPGNNQWASVQSSDFLGSIIKSRNLDFNEDGYASLARKPSVIFAQHTGVSATGDTDFDDCFAITADDTYYYFWTVDDHFILTASETAIAVEEPTTSSEPTVTAVCDAVSYNGAHAVTGNQTLHYFSGFTGTTGSGTWTQASDFSLDASYPHPLCRIEHRRTLAVGSKNVVYQTDAAAWTDDDTNILTLPSEYVVTSMRWRGNKLYIGTRTLGGTNAMLFVWSGSGTSAEAGYPVDADWIYAVTEYGSSVAVLTSAGQLLRFNGGGFDVLANLPVYYTPFSWTENAGAGSRGKAINRGIWTIGDTIYFTIQGEPRGLFAPGAFKQPGGLWVYDPRVGLYHRGGHVTEPYRNIAISSLSSDLFTMASAHGVETGDPVWAKSVSNIAALQAGYVYFAIKEGATTLKLAASPADAHAGRNLACSGTISGDELSFETLDAHGNVTSVTPGPVHGFTHNILSPFFASEVFYTSSSLDPVNAETSAINSFGMGRNVGYFITPKIYGVSPTSFFQSLATYVRGLNLDTDKVIVKYRTSERFGLPATTTFSTSGWISWLDASSFTVNTTVKDIRAAQVGDEIEIVKGAGAGYCAHISDIDDATSTWTVTLDESIPLIAASDTSDIYVDNWTKIATITNDTQEITKGFHDTALAQAGSSAWVQFKIELRGRDVSVNALNLINAVAKAS